MKNAALRMISIRVKNRLFHKIFLSKPGPIIDFAMSSQFKLDVLMSMLMLNVDVMLTLKLTLTLMVMVMLFLRLMLMLLLIMIMILQYIVSISI